MLRSAGGALAGIAAVSVAGCGSARPPARQSVKAAAPTVRSADVTLLNGLLDLERRTVAAYTAGIPLLTRPQAMTARQFLDEELEHTGELLSLIKAAQGVPVPRRASYDLGRPRSQADVLKLLDALEQAQISTYLAALPRLSPGMVRAAVASILASDAQHLAILRLVRGQAPVSSAFVT